MDAQLQRALRHLELLGAIVEIEQRNATLRTQSHRRVRHLQLDTRALIGPNSIAGHERAIDGCGHPLIVSGRLETHRAVDIGETCDARRRVGGRDDGDRHRDDSGDDRGAPARDLANMRALSVHHDTSRGNRLINH
jgi:hypothetical protein